MPPRVKDHAGFARPVMATKGFLLKYQVRKLLVWGALAFFSPAAPAIVNVEQAIIGPPSAGLHTTADWLASGASGNTEKSSNTAGFLSLWQHGEHTEFLQMQYAYGKSNGQVDTDRAFAHLRHRTALDAGWAVEGFVQVGRDSLARLMQRALAGGGLRWRLFEDDRKFAGYLGCGAFHEQETLSGELGTTDPTQAGRWRANSYLVLKRQLNGQVRLNNIAYYQPDTADTADFRILEQASMLVKLVQNLDLKVSLEIAYDSKPPQTVHKMDALYSTGLELSF